MADEKAAPAATDFYDLFSEPAKRAHGLMNKRLDVLLGRFSDAGDWVGGADETQEVAELVAAMRAIEDADMVEEHVQGISYIDIDIDLPGGGSFTARVAASVGDGAEGKVAGEHEHVPGSLRFRSKPIADPEAEARAEYARQDAARGENKKWAFEVDPMSAAFRSPGVGGSEEEWGEFYARRSAAYLGVPYEVIGITMGKRMTREKFVKSIWYQMFIDKIADEAAYYRSKGWLSDEASS